MSDDAALLLRYTRERAEDAFAELVHRHLDAVYSAALRRVGGDTHLAEDVAQQVFVALARNAAALSSREILAGWLYTTTRHLAANIVRGERRRKVREQQACAMNETGSESVSAADWSRIGPLLDGAIDELSESDRTAILLRFVDRRAFGEIGTSLRVTEDAARMRVERALDKLRALLERRGIASSSAALGVVLANHAVAAAPAGLAATVTVAASAATPTFAAVALNAFGIMSTTKSIGVAAALVAMIMALGTALYEANAHRNAETALAAAQKNHTAQLAQLGETERRVRLAEADVAQLRKAVDDARAAQATAKARALAEAEAAKKDAAWDGVMEGKALLVRHPELRQAFLDFEIAATRTRYARFLAAAQLTPAQADEFVRLMIEDSVTGFPFGPGGKMLALSLGPSVPGDERSRRLKTLLGDEGYKQFGQSGMTEAARNTAERVASALVFSDSPLTPVQAAGLVDAITSARLKPSKPGPILTDWEAVTNRALGFLAATQLRALASVRSQDEAQHAADKK